MTASYYYKNTGLHFDTCSQLVSQQIHFTQCMQTTVSAIRPCVFYNSAIYRSKTRLRRPFKIHLKNQNCDQTVGSFIILVLNRVLSPPCTQLSVLNTCDVLFRGPTLQPVLWSHSESTARFQERKKLKDACLTFPLLCFPLKLVRVTRKIFHYSLI